MTFSGFGDTLTVRPGNWMIVFCQGLLDDLGALDPSGYAGDAVLVVRSGLVLCFFRVYAASRFAFGGVPSRTAPMPDGRRV
jgi:hypothetical protein